MTTTDLSENFKGFIPNFQYKKDTLDTLINVLETSEPCLINIFPYFEDPDTTDENRFTEQGRKGGFGKTMLLTKCRDFLCKKNIEQLLENKIKPEDKPIIDLIELAEQYSTKEDILIKVYDALAKLDKNIASRGFLEFEETVKGNQNEISDEAESDPSFVAERLFDLDSKKYIIDYIKEEDKKAHFFLFFDAFDAQYLGGMHAPLRIWLINQLFPYLIVKMKALIIVSGREEIKIKEDIKTKFRLKTHPFVVGSFKVKQVRDYMLGYIKRVDDGKKVDHDKWENTINNISQVDISYLQKVTDGKPIFVDYFSDLTLRDCFLKEKEPDTIPNLLSKIKNTSSDETDKAHQEAFKQFLINQLYIYESNDKDVSVQRQIGQAISFLSVARHGLIADDYQELRTFGRFKSLEEDKNEEIKVFYKNTFTTTKLSYVKDRDVLKSIEKQVRLLHDEVTDLFLKYWYEKYDKDFIQRNRIIDYLTLMYEEKLTKLEHKKNVSNEYAKLLLEYIEYALMYQGRKQELAAINRLLYEFSYFLDRHPDLCSRLLEKGFKYYTLKRKEWIEKKEGNSDKTLTFSHDFSQIFKLRMREAEYCLTERSEGWKDRIKDVLTELDKLTNANSKFYTDENTELIPLKISQIEALGLKARSLCTEGEQQFWLGEWDEGRELVLKARQLFYDTGDSHGLAWAEHLLGFEAQRSGAFLQAVQYHFNAIETMLEHFPYLRRDIRYYKEKNKKLPYDLLYRLRFLIKTITRATGNWAVNLRYGGKILEAIKILESNLELANIVGLREDLRIQSNLALFYAIRGIESEHGKHLDRLTSEGKFNDPLIMRREKNRIMNRKLKRLDSNNVYVKTKEGFSISNEAIFLDENSFIELKKAILKPRLLLNVYEDKRIEFGLTNILNKALAEEWLGTPRPSREIADLYYQYSKAVVSSGIALEKVEKEGGFFEEARCTFINARYIADKATFQYLAMESSEALYRLSYLSPKHRHLLIEYQTNFDKYRKQIAEKPKEYGKYPDLLAKFYLTEGDVKLEKILNQSFFSYAAIQSALEDYVQALSYGYQHNQERYLLMLGAFEERILVILKAVHVNHRKINEFAQNIKTFFESQAIYAQDRTFSLYLNGLLDATILEVTEDTTANLSDLKWIIRQLVENGKFVKATSINKSLIHLLKDDKNSEELPKRYFQQFFSYLSSSQSSRAEKIIEKFYAHCPPSVSDFHEAVYNLMQGTIIYRTGELWNMEKFLLGELAFHRKKRERDANAKPLIESEQVLQKAINLFQNLIKKENKIAIKRLFTEAIFRLGELHTLLETTVINTNYLVDMPNIQGYIEKIEREFNVKFLESTNQEIQINILDTVLFNLAKAPPSVFYLWNAAFMASEIGDLQRETDALQSLVNAVYFYYFGDLKEDEEFEEIIFLFSLFQDCIRERLLKSNETKKYRFPIVVSKTYLVQGDMYFSWLFEKEGETDDKVLYTIRSFWNDKKQDGIDTKKAIKGKSVLHCMLKQYLAALNQLTDAEKPYESYHFNNMLLELNRRILSIKKKRYIRYLLEDLKPIWDSFPNLTSKKHVWDSLTFSLRVHEVAVASTDIFKLLENNNE
jgi:hypothetical protein